jgi:AraC-like DNA-binding protein
VRKDRPDRGKTLVLQGTKRIFVSDQVFEYEVGECMVVQGRHALTPLQYRKYIWLHEARYRLAADASCAAKFGFTVGYKSASQFSREYKPLLGAPPPSRCSSVAPD